MGFDQYQQFCVLDYETYSEAPLKKVGAFEYSVHPSTEILCAAWRIGTRRSLPSVKTQSWVPGSEKTAPKAFLEFLAALLDSDVILVAHNALFEQVVTRNVLGVRYAPERQKELSRLAPSRWLCTASLAAALALPRSLEGAGAALKLSTQKSKDGHRLMLKLSKPRKPSKKNSATRHKDTAEHQALVDYCIRDVDAEVELFLKAQPLTAKERKVWELDQAINLRGFEVDRPLVKTVLNMVAEETKKLNAETRELSGNTVASATQRDQVLHWLEEQFFFLPDLRKKTVEDVLAKDVWDPGVKRMLQLRQAVSKTSTAKYLAFEMRSRHDSRLRDNLVYHAASPGRWGGAGIQPQNFPRGTIKDTALAAEVLALGDLEFVRLLYGDPMAVFSSCLRSMITAPKGKILDVADYAAIETRVLFWVAEHKDGLAAFWNGRDLYREQAAEVFSVPVTGVDAFQRFVGKTCILGAGYGMGAEKFAATCRAQGQDVSLELATQAINSYRQTHAPVVAFWHSVGRAAKAAIDEPGVKFTTGPVSWWVAGEFLWCQLPSGRRLAYFEPTVTYEVPIWGGEKRPVLYHWGVDPLSKKWVNGKTYGGRLVENVVQAVARDIMAEAMLRIEAAGWQVVLSVHDEIGGERCLKSSLTNALFCELMAQTPAWAKGLPVKVEGYESQRYKK